MSVKPCVLKLAQMSVSRRSYVSSRKLMVPGYFMCSVGGSMLPSGTNGTTGATRALPNLRAIDSETARTT